MVKVNLLYFIDKKANMLNFLKFFAPKKNWPFFFDSTKFVYEENCLYNISILVNQNQINNSFLTKEIDLLKENEIFQLKTAYLKNKFIIKFRTPRTNFITDSTLEHEYQFQFGPWIDAIFLHHINRFTQNIKLVSTENVSTLQMQNGTKALEWIKASFKVLESAIIESSSNPELLFQTKIYFYNRLEGTEIRIILFNLDLYFLSKLNGELKIIIFDDKTQPHGSNKTPSLKGEFVYQSQQITDEIIKLLGLLSNFVK